MTKKKTVRLFEPLWLNEKIENRIYKKTKKKLWYFVVFFCFFFFGGFVVRSSFSRCASCSVWWGSCLSSGVCAVSVPVPSPFERSRASWVASGGPSRVFPVLPVPACVPLPRSVALRCSGPLPVWRGRRLGWLWPWDSDYIEFSIEHFSQTLKRYSQALNNFVSQYERSLS